MQLTAEGLALTLFVGVPYSLWDVFWFAGAHNSDEYKLAFLHLYHLETVTVELDLVPTLVVAVVAGFEDFWLEVIAWLLDPNSTCPDGCGLSKRPTP